MRAGTAAGHGLRFEQVPECKYSGASILHKADATKPDKGNFFWHSHNITAAKEVVLQIVGAGYVLFAHPKTPDYSFVLPLTQRQMYYFEEAPPPPPPGWFSATAWRADSDESGGSDL